MPDVVTFDVSGPGLFIDEISASGDNEIDILEMYSEWKVWSQLSDNLKYPPAFRVVGGDPISDVQDLGSTFFLNVGDGWKIRPSDEDHQLTLTGNLFTDPPEQNPIEERPTRTILVRQFVSNLVDAAVARLDIAQLLQAVYIDPLNGVPGTAEGVGTPTLPSDNITDARTIADNENLQAYQLRGSHTLAADHEEWDFVGLSAGFADILTMSGVSITNSRFTEMVLTGSMTGRMEAIRCSLQVLTGLDGIFRQCGLDGTVTAASNSDIVFDSCFSEIAGENTPIIVVGSNSTVSVRNYSGGMEIRGLTAGSTVSVDMDPGRLVMTDASNTGGTLLIRGTANKDIDYGLGVTVIETGLVDTELLYLGLQSLVGNVDISGDNLTIEIKDTDDVTVLRTLTMSADGRIRNIA